MLMILAIMGLAVSMWSDGLKIKAFIDPGDVDVRFDNFSTDDPPGTIDPGYDKNVATCTAELVEIEDEEEPNTNSGGDNDLDLSVTIINGYPSYTCTVNFTIINSGTLPVRLIEWFILPVQPPGSPNQTSILPLDIELIGIYIGYPLDPGESVDSILKVHVNQSASENSTYIFQIKFKFALSITTTTPPPPPQPAINLSKYFSDTNANPLTTDVDGAYNVSININPQGKATSSSPGHVVEIIVLRNIGSVPFTSGTILIEINISVDWKMDPDWGGSPTGNVHVCVYKGSTPSGFPYGSAWPFGPTCTSSGGTLITNTPGVTYSVSSTGSFPGFSQKLIVTIPISVLPGGSFAPGDTIAVSVKTKFAGIGETIPTNYFDKTNSANQKYKEFIDTAKATVGSLQATTQGIFRGYPK
ncbi:hypothetical protein ATG_02690 [Desulfurococcaceae archaeon AG1]|jgi:hypothetical protein|nr:hypothetical protein ATG_02690 [Desulfurococcaceae archaeon AG1]